MHLEVYRQRPDVKAVVHAHPPLATGFAVAGIPLDRAVLAEVITTLGSIPIADYATPSTSELPEAVRKYIKAHDGMLLANHGALTVGSDSSAPTTRWRRSSTSPRSASWRGCSGARTCSRARRSMRLQGLRGTYGIAAPAPICADPTECGGRRASDPAICQVVQAPAGDGERLVADVVGPRRGGGEIRLTYRELSALIEEAVRNLR